MIRTHSQWRILLNLITYLLNELFLANMSVVKKINVPVLEHLSTTRFFYKQHFYKKYQTEISKKLSKS